MRPGLARPHRALLIFHRKNSGMLLTQQDDPAKEPGYNHQDEDAIQREEANAPSGEHDITSALRATREQDRRKGKAVARQIVSGRVTEFAWHKLNMLYCRPCGTRSWMPVYDCRRRQLR